MTVSKYFLFIGLFTSPLLIIWILTRQTISLTGFSYRKQVTPAADWKPERFPTYLQNVSQFDTKLVQYIREKWLLPPFTGNRNLVHPKMKHYSQRGQSEFVDNLLRGKSNGFYIECGAADGEILSNSLFFEKSRNWSGLLIEANPISFSSLLKKRRHAYMINACLSPKRKPIIIPFTQARLIGGLADYMEQSHKNRIHRTYKQSKTTYANCFPLYSILKAMNINHVDYFSLDIEGAEMEVLYTIPLDFITIDVFSIEYVVSQNAGASKMKLENIKNYLVKYHDYKVVRVGVGEDIILKKN